MSEKAGMDERFVENGRRKYNVQAIWERHQEMIRQIVVGRTNVEIAGTIGCTPQTVSNLRNSPVAKLEIDRLSMQCDASVTDLSQRIEEFAPVALNLIENIIRGTMQDASLSLRAKLANSHLARAGYGEVHKVQSLHAHLSRGDIEGIKERARNNSEVKNVTHT